MDYQDQKRNYKSYYQQRDFKKKGNTQNNSYMLSYEEKKGTQDNINTPNEQYQICYVQKQNPSINKDSNKKSSIQNNKNHGKNSRASNQDIKINQQDQGSKIRHDKIHHREEYHYEYHQKTSEKNNQEQKNKNKKQQNVNSGDQKDTKNFIKDQQGYIQANQGFDDKYYDKANYYKHDKMKNNSQIIYYEKKNSSQQKNSYQKNNNNSYWYENKRHNNQRNNRKIEIKYMKKHYKSFIEESEVEKGLQEQRLYKGIFCANERSFKLAAIKSESFANKVYVNSLKNQNRAFDECTVIFRIIEQNVQEQSKNNAVESILEAQIVASNEQDPENSNKKSEENLKDIQDQEELQQELEELDEQSKQIEQKASKDEILDLIEPNEQQKIEAEVVYIIENPLIKTDIVGSLHVWENLKIPLTSEEKQGNLNLLQRSSFRKYVVFFQPNNKKLPRMSIQDIDQKLIKQISKLQEELNIFNCYFIARFQDWNELNLHPSIKLLSLLEGQSGNIEIECQAVLIQNKIEEKPFDIKCQQYLNQFKNESESIKDLISEEERNQRLDLTKEIIFTIDPPDSKDLDDALSIKHIKDDIYEVGVHIADVSYFVKEDSIVDLEASQRTTSIYFPHRVIPMLPSKLCEELCSLNEGVERLAFSVIFKIKENGTLIEDSQKFNKTIIKSRFKFSYDMAQQIIEDKNVEDEEWFIRFKEKQLNKDEIFDNIKKMNTIAKNIKQMRSDKGYLSLDKQKIQFELDQNNLPINFFFYKRKDAQFLVEEYMLLANRLAGQKLVENCKEIALLRKHEAPLENKIEYLQNLCQKLGFQLDFSSSKSLQESMENIQQDDGIKPEYKQILQMKIKNILQSAQYFMVMNQEERQWRHYALNFDIYTHFTSPIRRYSDIIVHRQLNMILENKNAVQEFNKEKYLTIVNQCNLNKAASRKVQDKSEKIFLCLLLKKQAIFVLGYIIQISKSYIKILNEDFNIEQAISTKFKSLRKLEFDDKNFNINLEVQDPNCPQPKKLTLKEFQPVYIRISAQNSIRMDLSIQLCLNYSQDQKTVSQKEEDYFIIE